MRFNEIDDFKFWAYQQKKMTEKSELCFKNCLTNKFKRYECGEWKQERIIL